MTTHIFMFPGQSSRDPTALERLLAVDPDNAVIVRQASEILGRDLRAQFHPDNPSAFARNADVQIGVFLANHLFWRMLDRSGITAELSLGLSLGEYNHLVHIGALDFPAALRLVAARGAAYDAGPDGAMASAFPVDLATLEPILARARVHGDLEISNYNSSRQFVIAGVRAAVDAALEILADEEAVQGVVIEERIPMHTPRFQPVAPVLRPVLEAAPWQPVRRPYLPNVLGELRTGPTAADFVELLTRHVYQPVRWRESIELLAERYPRATFIEVGPRAVLRNLLSPRWLRVTRVALDDRDDLAGVFAATVRRLRHAS